MLGVNTTNIMTRKAAKCQQTTLLSLHLIAKSDSTTKTHTEVSLNLISTCVKALSFTDCIFVAMLDLLITKMKPTALYKLHFI